MPELKEYKVAVTEVYRKTVTVRGTGERDAHQRAWDGWLNGEIILTEDDFEGSEFYVMPSPDDGEYEIKSEGDYVIQGYGSDDMPKILRKGTVKHGK